MPRLEILVIDHYERKGTIQLPGPIIQPTLVYPSSLPGVRYADFCALYEVWTIYRAHDTMPEMLGFFGYRKYLMPEIGEHTEYPEWTHSAHAVGWRQCDRVAFEHYRNWWTEINGDIIKRQLAQYDIIQAIPFPLKVNMITDFAMSRSEHDADVLRDVLRKHYIPSSSLKIYQYHFITRWCVFDRMMREMEPLRQELDKLITGQDSRDEAYKKRPMAYIMERVYSQWLQNSGLAIKEVPVLHCWDLMKRIELISYGGWVLYWAYLEDGRWKKLTPLWVWEL